MKGVWKSHYERLMNEKIEREALVSNMGLEAGGKHTGIQKGRKESNRQI